MTEVDKISYSSFSDDSFKFKIKSVYKSVYEQPKSVPDEKKAYSSVPKEGDRIITFESNKKDEEICWLVMRIINIACAIIEREGKFLLAKKSRDKKHPMKIEGEWHFPGGKAKNNEKIEDALLREIEEELGLKIRIEKLMSIITRKVNNECVLNFFWFFCCTSSTEVKKSKEIEEVTWVDKKEVLKYLREDLIRELPREVIELFS